MSGPVGGVGKGLCSCETNEMAANVALKMGLKSPMGT